MKITEIKYFRSDNVHQKPAVFYYVKGMVNTIIRKTINAFIQNDFEGTVLKPSAYQGGMVVLPHSATIDLSESCFSRLKALLQSTYYNIMNTHFENNKVNKLREKWHQEFAILDEMPLKDFEIAHSFKGFYRDENGLLYNQKSLTFDFKNLPTELLFVFALKLCKTCHQQTLLIIDMNTNKIYILENDTDTKTTPEEISEILNALSHDFLIRLKNIFLKKIMRP